MEAVGSAAAISQLAVQLAQVALGFVQLCLRMKEAPEVAKKQLQQVNHLNYVAQMIIQNKALQTVAVEKCLGNCLQIMSNIESKASEVTSSKLKRLISVRTEDRMLMTKLFDELEREKSSLLLCIESVDVALLDTINSTVQQISTEVHDSALQAEFILQLVKNVETTLSIVEQNSLIAAQAVPATSIALEEIKNAILAISTQMKSLALSNAQPPTSLPPPGQKYFIVPNRRTNNFVGRKDVLLKIDDGRQSSSANIPVAVIRAMGGQGKTQIAQQYYFTKRNNPFETVFWLDATSTVTLTSGFENVYASIKSANVEHSTFDQKLQYVFQWLEDRKAPWLLIFDNHDKLDFRVQDYFPPNGRGFLIVTTRNADLEDIATDDFLYIDLQVLDDETAVELLFKTSTKKSSDEKLQSLALDIVHRLGNHALAVVQAGSYIKTLLKLDFGRFLDKFEQQQEEILKTTLAKTEYRRKIHGSPNDKEIELSVFTTWELSFQQLVEETSDDSVEVKLLTLMAYFDIQDISEMLFEHFDYRFKRMSPKSISLLQWLDHFQDRNAWNTDNYRKILIKLTSVALVQSWDVQEDGYAHATIHPLVRDWIRIRTSTETNIANEVITWHILGACIGFHEDLSQDRPVEPVKRRMIEKHLLIAINRGLELKCAKELELELVEAQRRCYGLLWVDQHYESLEMLCRKVINVLGIETSQSFRSIRYLSGALQCQKKYEESQKFLNQALEIRKTSSSTSVAQNIQLELYLAVNLKALGKIDESEICLRELLARSEGLGLPQWLIRDIYLELGTVLYGRGDFLEAQIAQRKVCAISDEHYGSQSIAARQFKGPLGLTLQILGQYDDALICFEDCIEACVWNFGLKHPTTVFYIEHRDRCRAEIERRNMNGEHSEDGAKEEGEEESEEEAEEEGEEEIL